MEHGTLISHQRHQLDPSICFAELLGHGLAVLLRYPCTDTSHAAWCFERLSLGCPVHWTCMHPNSLLLVFSTSIITCPIPWHLHSFHQKERGNSFCRFPCFPYQKCKETSPWGIRTQLCMTPKNPQRLAGLCFSRDLVYSVPRSLSSHSVCFKRLDTNNSN